MITVLSSPKNITQVQKNNPTNNKNLWLLWLLVLVVVLFIQLSTAGVLPDIQKDEVQITDYGRLTLNPKSDWSATWLLGTNKPLFIWSYLGPLIAELGYRWGDGLGTSERITSILGGLAAATIAFGWLLSRRVPRFAALLLSTAFFVRPSIYTYSTARKS